jgi:hypothetical protein
MSVNMNVPVPTSLFNPGRDVAQLFPFLAVAVVRNIEAKVWPELHEKFGGDDEQGVRFASGILAFSKFVAAAADVGDASMDDRLKAAGFHDLDADTRIVLMAYLGQLVLGLCYHGVREITLNNVGPLSTAKSIVDLANQAAARMAAKEVKNDPG